MTAPFDTITVAGAAPVPRPEVFPQSGYNMADERGSVGLDDGRVLNAKMLHPRATYYDGDAYYFHDDGPQLQLEFLSGDDLNTRSVSTIIVNGLDRGVRNLTSNDLDNPRANENIKFQLQAISATHVVIGLQYLRTSTNANGFATIVVRAYHQALLQVGEQPTLAAPFEVADPGLFRYLRAAGGVLRIDPGGLRKLTAPSSSLATGGLLRTDITLNTLIDQSGSAVLFRTETGPVAVDLRRSATATPTLQLAGAPAETVAVLSGTAVAWIDSAGLLTIADGAGEHTLQIPQSTAGRTDYELHRVQDGEALLIERHAVTYFPGWPGPYEGDAERHAGLNPAGPLAEGWSHDYTWRAAAFVVAGGVVTQTRPWTHLTDGSYRMGEAS